MRKTLCALMIVATSFFFAPCVWGKIVKEVDKDGVVSFRDVPDEGAVPIGERSLPPDQEYHLKAGAAVCPSLRVCESVYKMVWANDTAALVEMLTDGGCKIVPSEATTVFVDDGVCTDYGCYVKVRSRGETWGGWAFLLTLEERDKIDVRRIPDVN